MDIIYYRNKIGIEETSEVLRNYLKRRDRQIDRLYAIFDRKYERTTTDIAFLARRISNSSGEMKTIFQRILSQELDDALVFDTDSITVEDIAEFKEYHGLHISAVGYLDRTRIPVGIDIGFGDVVYPDAVKMESPVILDMEPPIVNAYSLESAMAEKLEARGMQSLKHLKIEKLRYLHSWVLHTTVPKAGTVFVLLVKPQEPEEKLYMGSIQCNAKRLSSGLPENIC